MPKALLTCTKGANHLQAPLAIHDSGTVLGEGKERSDSSITALVGTPQATEGLPYGMLAVLSSERAKSDATL